MHKLKTSSTINKDLNLREILKTLLDIDNWPQEHFLFLNNLKNLSLDYGRNRLYYCLYKVKRPRNFLFIYYLHKTLVTVNNNKSFRYRISDEQIYIYDRIDASATIGRADGTLAFP
jgi:chloramphenicol O-acetyltransferase type A